MRIEGRNFPSKLCTFKTSFCLKYRCEGLFVSHQGGFAQLNSFLSHFYFNFTIKPFISATFRKLKEKWLMNTIVVKYFGRILTVDHLYIKITPSKLILPILRQVIRSENFLQFNSLLFYWIIYSRHRQRVSSFFITRFIHIKETKHATEATFCFLSLFKIIWLINGISAIDHI